VKILKGTINKKTLDEFTPYNTAGQGCSGAFNKDIIEHKKVSVRSPDAGADFMGRFSKDIALIRQFFVIPPKVMVDIFWTLQYIATRNNGVSRLESFILQ
jgi:hypothetical protein